MELTVEGLLQQTQSDLELQLVAGRAGLQRRIENCRIQKPGLAIAGLVEAIRPGRVQVFGNTEIQYLRGLDSSNQRAALQGLFEAAIPCVVVTTGLKSPLDLVQSAELQAVPLLATPLTSGTFISRIHPFFDENISPEVVLHGVLVDVFGVGMLLCGQSGIGKSECALDLILRGHRLVADDVVLVRQYDRELMGMNMPLTKHHMEVRGLGIINVRDLFGAASVCERKRVEIIVEMLEWQHDGNYDRMGVDDDYESVLDTEVPRIRLPLRPGRNVASIVEVAARNHLLKLQGHHSARQFQESLERRLELEGQRLQRAAASTTEEEA